MKNIKWIRITRVRLNHFPSLQQCALLLSKLLCEVKFEIYRFALWSNKFWFKNKSITNRYITKKPKYVSIPFFWLPPRAIKRTRPVSTMHIAHVSGLNIWKSQVFNIHICLLWMWGTGREGSSGKTLIEGKATSRLSCPLVKTSWPPFLRTWVCISRKVLSPYDYTAPFHMHMCFRQKGDQEASNLWKNCRKKCACNYFKRALSFSWQHHSQDCEFYGGYFLHGWGEQLNLRRNRFLHRQPSKLLCRI